MLTVDEVRALVTTSISDADLADVIAREESWLARRVGLLEGERVDTFPTEDGDEVLRLKRHTDAISVSDDDGEYVGASLRGWSDVVPDASVAWNGDVLVTYTPDDEDEVKRALITLVRLTINESAYATETTSGYAVASDVEAQRRVRYSAWRALLRPRQPSTVRIRSVIPSGGKTLEAVATEASGS